MYILNMTFIIKNIYKYFIMILEFIYYILCVIFYLIFKPFYEGHKERNYKWT